jgi:hypothetical protein
MSVRYASLQSCFKPLFFCFVFSNSFSYLCSAVSDQYTEERSKLGSKGMSTKVTALCKLVIQGFALFQSPAILDLGSACKGAPERIKQSAVYRHTWA